MDIRLQSTVYTEPSIYVILFHPRRSSMSGMMSFLKPTWWEDTSEIETIRRCAQTCRRDMR